ncbi:hypothetical protein ACIF8W_17705 [Streptomyces sp. NPDC085639]|uniref:hypothetical protein n=1 Tax=Streptomyces sp. NPDC085639 TaxID=3365734 RepID=UPI0037D7B624
MNADGEQLLRGRVYGHDHDEPNPGPLRHQTYAVLVGGPLDGLLLDITGWRAEEIEDGVALMTALGRWPGGLALYHPPRRSAPGGRPGCGVPLPLRRALTLAGAAAYDRPSVSWPASAWQPAEGEVGLRHPRNRPRGRAYVRAAVRASRTGTDRLAG